MNNATLKVRIESINPMHLPDGALQITALSAFKFFNKSEAKIKPLNIQAYGATALAINQAGIGSILIVSGRLSIYKPSDQNPNHQMLLSVEKVIVIQAGMLPQNIVQFPQITTFPNQQMPTFANNNNLSYTAPMNQPAMATQGNGKVANFDDIPF
jgi:hypothetical protein